MTRTMSSTALLTVALVVTLVATVAGGAMAAWAVSQSVVAALEGGKRDRARMLLDRSAADSRRLFDDLDEFRTVSQDETAVAVLAIQDRADWTLRAIGLVGGGFLVMSAFAWVLILRLVNSQRHALAERMQALEASNRELEAFAGRVAHDMRNVLSPIRLAADAIDASSTDPATRAIAERIGRSCLRGSDLVEALLTFSRAAGRADTAPQSAKLAKELANVLEQLEQQIRDTGVQVLQRVPKSAYVAITPALLHVVLVNLIGNAVKFMQDCTDRRLTVYACEEGEHWRIDVSDTGPGIPESEIDHVFEALYRGAGARGSGVGLGLATVKRVVESHGGRVELRSSPGRGTTVTVCLPRAVSRVARANHEGAPTTPAISTS